jgi:tRNA nucleotidyltransferase (CCA-adding enzyme)
MTIEYFKVGGFVRDAILGVKSKDIDYAVQAPSYEAMAADIVARGGKIFYEKPEYLTIRAKMNGEDADFVLCRKEGAYSDARHPDKVEPGTIDDDLARV